MTREDIIRMARETGVEWLMHNQFYKDHLQHFAALVAAAEREASAKVCDAWSDWSGSIAGLHAARKQVEL